MPELLQLAAARIEPGTEIVLVSTRPVDLAQPDYAGRLPGDMTRRLGGPRAVDTRRMARIFSREQVKNQVESK